MTAEEIRNRIAACSADISALGVRRLSLFGSVVRGEADEDSDVDVLVEFDGKATFDGYMDLKFLLEDLLGRKVDLVTSKALRPEIRSVMEQEAVYVA